MIPENGIYELVISIYATNPHASIRTTPHMYRSPSRPAVQKPCLDDEGTTYLRGATGSQQVGAIGPHRPGGARRG